MTVWLTPISRLPRSGIQCSRNSRRLTRAAPAAFEPRERGQRTRFWCLRRSALGVRDVAGRFGRLRLRRALRDRRGGGEHCDSERSQIQCETAESNCGIHAVDSRAHWGRASGRLSRRFCGFNLSRALGVHRHREIDGAAGDRRSHVAGIRERQLEQAKQPPHPLVVDLGAIVQVVEQRARLGVEPDVPHPAPVVDLALRTDRDGRRRGNARSTSPARDRARRAPGARGSG